MKGINAKETMLAGGTALMGFGTALVQTDLVKGLILIAASVLVFFVRGYLKEDCPDEY